MARKWIPGNPPVPLPFKRGGVIYEHIYEITLYPISENLQFDIVLKKVELLFPLIEWAFIFHQFDKDENGKIKKPHYHLLLNFPRERSMEKLARDLEIPLSAIEWKCFLDKSVQYLIHLNDPDKYQYDVESISGSSNWYLEFLGGDYQSDLSSELKMLSDFLDNNRDHITYREILRYASEHNMLKTYKSWYMILKDIYLDGKN